MSDQKLVFIKENPSKYVKLNVGGRLFSTTIDTLTKHDSMLKAMFSGEKQVLIDTEGYVLFDRSGEYFDTILNYFRDGINGIQLPDTPEKINLLLNEAKYYCITELIFLCENAIKKDLNPSTLCSITLSLSAEENITLVQKSIKPVIILNINREKFTKTMESLDNFEKNIDLFEQLSFKYGGFIKFVKYISSSSECSWCFYKNGVKLSEVVCTNQLIKGTTSTSTTSNDTSRTAGRNNAPFMFTVPVGNPPSVFSYDVAIIFPEIEIYKQLSNLLLQSLLRENKENDELSESLASVTLNE